MKKMVIWGVTAGAAAATIVALMYKRKDGTRLSDGLMDSARSLGSRLMDYGNELRDRLMHNVKGPNGEPVFIDMYDRQFYEDQMGKRVYLQND